MPNSTGSWVLPWEENGKVKEKKIRERSVRYDCPFIPARIVMERVVFCKFRFPCLLSPTLYIPSPYIWKGVKNFWRATGKPKRERSKANRHHRSRKWKGVSTMGNSRIKTSNPISWIQFLYLAIISSILVPTK